MNNQINKNDALPVIYPRGTHTLRAHMVDYDARKVIGRLVHHGYRAHVVGGGVRDLLLGKQPKDFDLATDASPKEIRKLFRNSRIIGRRFQLVHVFFGPGKNIEVATFRANAPLVDPEAEIEEEHSFEEDNTFGTEETDALRRDLTINGLFFDATSEEIIDYVGGMEDLRNRIVRVIGSPTVRFEEDPVRLLRVVRHAARSGFQIEPETHNALLTCGQLLRNASQVRIFEELRKDIGSGDLLSFLRLLKVTELLPNVIPDIEPDGLAETSPLAETLARFDVTAQGSQTPSSAVFFAILARFCPVTVLETKDGNKIDLQFATQESLVNHIQTLFPLLAVPRREREKVEQILQLWLALYKDQEVPLSPRAVQGISQEFADFCKLLPAGPRDKEIFQGFRAALVRRPHTINTGPSDSEDQSRRPRRRRRRGVRNQDQEAEDQPEDTPLAVNVSNTR